MPVRLCCHDYVIVLMLDFAYRFPIPDVPPGWKPNPRRVWDKENAPVSNKGKQRADPKTMSHAQWKNSLLSADEVRVSLIILFLPVS